MQESEHLSEDQDKEIYHLKMTHRHMLALLLKTQFLLKHVVSKNILNRVGKNIWTFQS